MQSLDNQNVDYTIPPIPNNYNRYKFGHSGQLPPHDTTLDVVTEVRGPCEGPLCLHYYLHLMVMLLHPYLRLCVVVVSCFYLRINHYE